MKTYRNLFLIFLGLIIIMVSFYFRRQWLDISPASINFDEAALGYNAYSLLKTGKDEHGNPWPVSLASFNDYKPALYAYLSIPFIKFLGLNQVSTRLVSAIAGTVTLIITGFISYYLFKSLPIAILSLYIAAIQPWGLHFSRTAFESNLATAFFTIGIFLIIKNNNFKSKLLAILPFALSMYSYHSPRVAAPLLLFFLIITQLVKSYRNKTLSLPGFIKIVSPAILLLFLTLPIWFNLKDGLILTRFKQEGAIRRLYPYSPPELVNLNNIWTSLPANPAYYLTAQFIGHFLAYFSPVNLGERVFHWVKGSPQYIPTFSMIGWGESIFFLVGLLYLLKHLKESKNKFILFWIISGIAPAAITWNWFHPLRTLVIYPAITIVVIMGIVQILKTLSLIPRVVVLIVFSIFSLMQISYVANNELVYGVYSAHGEYQPGGFKEGVPELAKIQDDYDKVIIETPHAQGYIFFLFYQSFPPEILHQYAKNRKPPGTEGDLSFSFYKYEFRKIFWPEDKKLSKTIFWGSVFSLPREEVVKEPGVELIKEFKDVLGNTAAVMVAKK